MDNNTALHLAKTGGSILILDFPLKGSFGIDMKSWSTGEKFKGIKMIPEGVHLIHYSNGSEMAAMCSFFIEIKRGTQLSENVTVGKWDPKTESIIILNDDDSEGYKQSIVRLEFDDGLAPYPFDMKVSWDVLISNVTQSDIERVRPVSKVIHSSTQPSPDGKEIDPHGPTANLFFATAPVAAPEGISSTCWNFDGSHKLKYLINKTSDATGRSVLADFQLSFTMFLISQNYDAFEHWKSVLQIICTSESLLSSNLMIPFFTVFCDALNTQLSHIPVEFYDLDAAYLPHQISQFKELQDDISDVEFRRAAANLFSKAEDLFGELGCEDDDVMVVSEDAPQY